jgi:hypothetical protein
MLAFKTIFPYISGLMKRYFIGFFLLLGALLLSSPRPAAAHTYRPDHHAASPERIKIPHHVVFNTESDDVTHIHRPASSEKTFHKLDLAEVEEEVDYEDELTSFKRHSSTINYPSSIFCAQTLGYFFSYSKEVLSFQKSFIYTASSRYLVFLVFRI